MVSVTADVIAGPATAARLGVPVGSVITTQEARYYRSRWQRTLWRLRHPRGGHITTLKGSK